MHKDQGPDQDNVFKAQPQRTGGRIDDVGDSGSGRGSDLPASRDSEAGPQQANRQGSQHASDREGGRGG